MGRIARRLHRDLCEIESGRQLSGSGHIGKRIEHEGAEIGEKVHLRVLIVATACARGLSVASILTGLAGPPPAAEPLMFLQGEAVGHAGDIVGDDAGQLGFVLRGRARRPAIRRAGGPGVPGTAGRGR